MKVGDRVRINENATLGGIKGGTPSHWCGREGTICEARDNRFGYGVQIDDDTSPGLYYAHDDELEPLSPPQPWIVDTAGRVRQVLTNVADLVEIRNREYGDAALHPAGILADGDARHGLRYRIDEKLARLRKQEDLGEDSSDTIDDLIGLLALLRVAERQQ